MESQSMQEIRSTHDETHFADLIEDSFSQTIFLQTDKSIFLEGIECFTSVGVTELILFIRQHIDDRENPLVHIATIYGGTTPASGKVETDTVRVDFDTSVLLKAQNVYIINATIKGQGYQKPDKSYLKKITSHGVNFKIDVGYPVRHYGTLFSCLVFRKCRGTVSLKVPITS